MPVVQGSAVQGNGVLEVFETSRSDIGVVLQTTVRLTSLLAGDSEIVTLDETAELSGLFTGSFPTSTAVGAAGDGVRTQARGASLGKDVQVGPDAQVTLESAFAGQ